MSVPDKFITGDGPHLVEASAGTGKTYWMVETAVKLLLHHPDVPQVGKPERLLAMTFTRAATAELKGRLRAELQKRRATPEGARNERLAEVIESLDRLAVTTIHGFCMGVLEEFALECGVPVGLNFVEDIADYLDAAVADEWRALTWERSPESELVVSALLERKTDLWSPEGLRKAALKVRGAIGATRPARLASRAGLRHERQEALAVVVKTSEGSNLREFIAKVRWKSDGMEERQVEQLETALAAASRGDGFFVEDITRWSTSSLKEKQHGTYKKNNLPLIEGLALADAAERLEQAHSHSGELLWQDAVLAVVDRLEAALRHDRVAGFDDMIAMVARALDGEHGTALRKKLSDRYDAVLVDEFQDTDWAQWQIFDNAFSSKPLILVGDPKQSVYGFRGADISAYYNAKEKAGTRVFSQDKNWRSDAGLVEATNLLFKAEQPFAVNPKVLGFTDVTAEHQGSRLTGDATSKALVLLELGTDTVPKHQQRIATYIAQEVVRVLSDPSIRFVDETKVARRLEASDIAILVNANYQAQPILRALRAAGVAAVSGATGDITESDTWRDVQAVLAAVDDPSDDRGVRRALATSLAGRSAAELHAMVRDVRAWRLQVDLLVEARREWARRGVLTAISKLLASNEWQSVARLSARVDAERRLTDLRHVIGLLQSAEREGHRSPTQMRTWARRFAERSGEQSEARQQHLESDRKAVQISTVHGAKGLEWPMVFCPFLWRAPKERKELAKIVRRSSDGKRHVRLVETPFEDEEAGDPPLSERLRLAYVALTRAQCRTYVMNATSKKKSGTASLEHLLAHYGSNPGAQLSAASAHVLSVIGFDYASDARLEHSEHEADALAAVVRPVPAERLRSWSVSSYTQLTKHAAHSHSAEDAGPVDDAEVAAQDTSNTLRANQLPGGAHVGNALHLIFEKLNFTAFADPAHRDPIIEEVMATYALPRPAADAAARAAAAELITRMIAATLDTPMPTASLALSSVATDKTLREWRFHLPTQGLKASSLAQVFRAYGESWLATEYAPLLERVSGRPLDGFLNGIVDLVALVDGRWWIVDWKSNALGPMPEDYDADGCRHEMMRTHYVLQYHLYCVALHRFLRSRVREYDYARDCGGAGYAFLRGLAMGVPSWFVDRPSPALIAALDAAVGGTSV